MGWKNVHIKFIMEIMVLSKGQPRTATGMDGTLPNCNFENLKPVEIPKNVFGII